MVVEETLQGIASVKAFANESLEIARYRSGVEALIQVVLPGRGFKASLVPSSPSSCSVRC